MPGAPHSTCNVTLGSSSLVCPTVVLSFAAEHPCVFQNTLDIFSGYKSRLLICLLAGLGTLAFRKQAAQLSQTDSMAQQLVT